jgi:alkylhydroperoxidase family enzyme
MTFIETVPAGADASDDVTRMYETDREVFGHVPNFTRAFSHRPDVYAAWRQLNGAIKAGMDLRRYELATIAAARRLPSSYCTLAHGSVLMDNFVAPDELTAIVSDHRDAGGALLLQQGARRARRAGRREVRGARRAAARDADRRTPDSGRMMACPGALRSRQS